jgi:CRISPR-associated endonuclease Cas1
MAGNDRTNAAKLTPTDVAEIGDELARVFARDATSSEVVVLDGAGCALRLRYGTLLAEDGLGRHRRVRRWTRAMPPSRIVILSNSGFLGLDALSWCEAVGTEVVGIDPYAGRIRYETAAAAKRDRRLIRAQAVAGLTDDHPTGVAIVRYLLRAKLAGQEQLARTTLELPETADTIAALADALDDADSIEQARTFEASAAAACFAGWVDHDATRVRFADRDRDRIPEHWFRYDGRRSILGARNSSRRAATPLNSTLNYAFSLLRAEAVIALRIVGLDPDLGLLHLDGAGRPGMALDVMEPVRPQVEAFVLELVSQRVFRKVDFAEDRDGVVRLGVALRTELASTLPRWARAVAPFVETVAVALGELVATDYRTSTPITGAKRKAATARVPGRQRPELHASNSRSEHRARAKILARARRPAYSAADRSHGSGTNAVPPAGQPSRDKRNRHVGNADARSPPAAPNLNAGEQSTQANPLIRWSFGARFFPVSPASSSLTSCESLGCQNRPRQ